MGSDDDVVQRSEGGEEARALEGANDTHAGDAVDTLGSQDLPAPGHRSPMRRDQARHGVHHGALASTVRPDQRRDASPHLEAQAVKDRVASESNGEILNLQHGGHLSHDAMRSRSTLGLPREQAP